MLLLLHHALEPLFQRSKIRITRWLCPSRSSGVHADGSILEGPLENLIVNKPAIPAVVAKRVQRHSNTEYGNVWFVTWGTRSALNRAESGGG